MTEYIVNYEIPSKMTADPTTVAGALSIVISEGRSDEYREVWNRLDEIGQHIMTSAYKVQYDGSADALVQFVLGGLDLELRKRVKLLAVELTQNSASSFHGETA